MTYQQEIERFHARLIKLITSFETDESFFHCFSSEEFCRDELEKIRWNNAPRCPACGGKDIINAINLNKTCKRCKTGFSVKQDNVFYGIHKVKDFLFFIYAVYLGKNITDAAAFAKIKFSRGAYYKNRLKKFNIDFPIKSVLKTEEQKIKAPQLKYSREIPYREEFKKMFQEHTVKELALAFKVSERTIERWRSKYRIASKSKEVNKYLSIIPKHQK